MLFYLYVNCKLYEVDFTKSHQSSKTDITLCTAKFQGFIASKTYSVAFSSYFVAPRGSACCILNFADRVITLKQMQI